MFPTARPELWWALGLTLAWFVVVWVVSWFDLVTVLNGAFGWVWGGVLEVVGGVIRLILFGQW